MAKTALETYRSVEKAAASGRELEAAALFKAAHQIETVQRGWNAENRDVQLDAALRYNLSLWSFFQAELSDAGHPMPVDLRVNLLQLSKFIDRRTFEVMATPDPEKLQALININRQIAMGLSEKPAAAGPAGGP